MSREEEKKKAMLYNRFKLAGVAVAGFIALFLVYEWARPNPAKEDLVLVKGVVEAGEIALKRSKSGDPENSAWFRLADGGGTYAFEMKWPGFGYITDLKVGDEVEMLVHKRIIPSWTIFKVWEMRINGELKVDFATVAAKPPDRVGALIQAIIVGLLGLGLLATTSFGDEGQQKKYGALQFFRGLIGK